MSAAAVTWGIAERSVKLIPRVPSTFIPSLVMPVFLTIAFSGPFASLVDLPGFPADHILDWVVPFTALQGCAFAGITTGMGLARDLENGFYDRILMSPAPRSALLWGAFVATILRAGIALALMLLVGVVSGAHFRDGIVGIAALTIAGLGLAFAAGAWAIGLALRFKTQQIAPLMQTGVFLSTFLSTAQMPVELMTGWLDDVASVNPVTYVLALARQGFLGDVTWAVTQDGLLALGGMIVVLVAFAYRGMQKVIP
ncbi:MAG: ABC transporter permease [Actinobacteria bacterium]|nr:ABC transporter permease [Actinomycetota bacterium]